MEAGGARSRGTIVPSRWRYRPGQSIAVSTDCTIREIHQFHRGRTGVHWSQARSERSCSKLPVKCAVEKGLEEGFQSPAAGSFLHGNIGCTLYCSIFASFQYVTAERRLGFRWRLTSCSSGLAEATETVFSARLIRNALAAKR